MALGNKLATCQQMLAIYVTHTHTHMRSAALASHAQCVFSGRHRNTPLGPWLCLGMGTTPLVPAEAATDDASVYKLGKETSGLGNCRMKQLDIFLGDFGAPTKSL